MVDERLVASVLREHAEGDVPADPGRVDQVWSRIRSSRRRRAALVFALVAAVAVGAGVRGALPDSPVRSSETLLRPFPTRLGHQLAGTVLRHPGAESATLEVQARGDAERLSLAFLCTDYDQAGIVFRISRDGAPLVAQGEPVADIPVSLGCQGPGPGGLVVLLLPKLTGGDVQIQLRIETGSEFLPTPEEALRGLPQGARAVRVGVFGNRIDPHLLDPGPDLLLN